MTAAPTPADVAAACRDYDHQRECILDYLSACKAVTDDRGAGGKLTKENHLGSEFDTESVRVIAEAFLAVSDVRMQVGSKAERVALATLTYQFRRLLPTAPLTTTLAEVVRAAGSRQGQNGADKRTSNAAAQAERVRDIIELAERKPGRPHLFKHPGAVLDLCKQRLNRKTLDRNTLNGYREVVDRSMKIDGSHVPD